VTRQLTQEERDKYLSLVDQVEAQEPEIIS
jgi:hypothetical protein